MRQPLQRLGAIIPQCIRTAGLRRFPGSQRSLFISRRLTPRSCPTPPSFQHQISRGYAKEVPSPNTRGISQTEYQLRRTILSESIPDGSVCVLVGASMKYASDSVLYFYKCFAAEFSYPFHQDPNFYYLTGFVERNALAVIRTLVYLDQH